MTQLTDMQLRVLKAYAEVQKTVDDLGWKFRPVVHVSMKLKDTYQSVRAHIIALKNKGMISRDGKKITKSGLQYLQQNNC